ncbi:MAG: Erythronolide synthase, modules 1 and 2 [Firmicutes bacterium ADurb.Bin419]|nr:MAG: Erythronolide synthase, modules 1 and 2 [Firmicutes bacterium ADurb.Bin419]
MNKVNLNFKNFNFTLQTGREAMEHRLAIAALNPDELILKLTAFIDREDLFSDNEKNSIYYSHTKGEISGTAFNEEDAEVNRLAEHYYEQKDITNLAKLWISGADIKWQRMYLADENIQRIPLPGYPFRRTEYWISKAKASVTKSKKDNSSDEEFFDYKWVELPLDASASKEEDGQLVQYVLFCDRQGISDRFIELLETKKLKYYRIEWADALKKVGENNYTIDPYNKSDYDYVFIDIHSKSRKSKTYVLNFWPLDYKQLPDYKLSDFDKAIKFTCTTAFNMIQSIISNDQIDNQQVWFLCSNVQPVENQSLNLLPVALWGAAKSIILEQPNILRSIIDIGQLDEYEPQELFNEVNQDTLEGEIVYRNKKRYVSRMVPTEVQPTNELIIAKDGTYLVTGGLGSLGLLTGKWLSEKKAGKILLLSRSGLDMERDDDATLKKIQMINLMKSSGAEVEVLVADVTKKAQLKKVLQKYMDKKELRGIFHTAGVYQSDYVKDMTYLNFDSVIKAKINGTWNLHEITKNYKLDYFVQYSSGVAIWGSASASHYGAANYFLDIYAHYCKMAGLSATSISWGGLWENSNIAANENEEYMKTMGVKVIPSERGMGQLETILRSGETHKVVAPIKWDSFLPVMNFKRKNMLFEYIASSKLRDQGTGDGAFDENDSVSFIKAIAGLPREEMKRVIIESLAHLLKEVLGIGLSEDISSDAGFFALGLDSLTSIDFRNKLEKKLAIEISTTSLFDYNTLELLADYILENYCASANDNLAEVSAVPAADELKPDYLSEEELSKLDEMDNSELLEILKKEMEITN